MTPVTLTYDRLTTIVDRFDYTIELFEKLNPVLDPEKYPAVNTVRDFLIPEIGVFKTQVMPHAYAAARTDKQWTIPDAVLSAIDRANNALLDLTTALWDEDSRSDHAQLLGDAAESLRWSMRVITIQNHPRDKTLLDFYLPPGYAHNETTYLTQFISFLISVYLKDKIRPLVQDNPDLGKDVEELSNWLETGGFVRKNVVIEGDLRDQLTILLSFGYIPAAEEVKALLKSLRAALEKWSHSLL